MNQSLSKIKDILKSLLENLDHEIKKLEPKKEPLFMTLKVKPNLVGFAYLNGHPEENYKKAFSIFKELYADHSEEWADFDLTLVLCKEDYNSSYDSFYQKIEVDPYFCRKFVVDLKNDINSELGRLPFIPLGQGRIIDIKRPPAAQEFLMEHSVKATLARYLATPFSKGIINIVNDCLEGRLGGSKWIEKDTDFFPISRSEKIQNIRLKKLRISNFRAYRGEHEFDLDSDLIILYGPNGLGKTSFFDAIDFACTGGVARFDERFGKKIERLKNTLRHLDSNIEDSYVRAILRREKKDFDFKRNLKTRQYAQEVNNGKLSGKDTLFRLTGLNKGELDLGVLNFIRLFRATHLFGQEFQSLTPGRFKKESALPEDTVSRMLALQDYVEAIKKTKGITEELNRRIKREDDSITSLKEDCEKTRKEMEQYINVRKKIKKPDNLILFGKKLVEDLTKELEVPIESPAKFSIDNSTHWKGKVASKINSLKNRLKEIEKIQITFNDFIKWKEEKEDKSVKLSERKNLLANYNEECSEIENSLNVIENEIKEQELEEKRLAQQIDNLNWVVGPKKKYRGIKNQISGEEEIIWDIKQKQVDLLTKVEALNLKKNEIDDNIRNCNKNRDSFNLQLREINNVEPGFTEWQTLEINLKKSIIGIEENKKKEKEIYDELTEKNNLLNILENNRKKIEYKVKCLQKNQSELKRSLDEIETYINNNICPVCGTKHQTKEDLINKLNIRRGLQPEELKESLKELNESNLKKSEINKRINELSANIEQIKFAIKEKDSEVSRIKERIKNIEEKANALDITLSSNNFKNVLNLKKKDLREKIDSNLKNIDELKLRSEKISKELVPLENQKIPLENDLKINTLKFNNHQSSMREIESEVSRRKISLEIEDHEIIEQKVHCDENIKKVIENLEKKREKSEKLARQKIQNHQKMKTKENEIEKLEKEISSLDNSIKGAEESISKLKLDSNITFEKITIEKKSFEEKLSSLDSLENEIINFGIMLDAEQLSAIMSKLTKELENLKIKIKEKKEEVKNLKEWIKFFKTIDDNLKIIQKRSLEEYTGKYGPLTSTIQKRLRPVFGFGNIILQPEENEIFVKVKREYSGNLSPGDFFSESQMQIIMLSLFLTAALTQTWSCFSPILLDDPVQHFDDLNAYSFIDFIRGLYNECDFKPQLIISTCDHRFFRLMQQKFGKMEEKPIFYEFESIGKKGPVYKKL